MMVIVTETFIVFSMHKRHSYLACEQKLTITGNTRHLSSLNNHKFALRATNCKPVVDLLRMWHYCAAIVQAALHVLLVRLSVRPPVSPVRAGNSKTKKRRKIKIGVDVLHGTSKWSANFQFERSKVKVTGRKNPQNLASCLLTGGSADCTLGLRHCQAYFTLATGRTAAYNVGADISCCRYAGKIPTSHNEQRVWPKHVLRQDWVPLNDLLGHVNTRLLISHCGANSQFEVRINRLYNRLYKSFCVGLAHLQSQCCFLTHITSYPNAC